MHINGTENYMYGVQDYLPTWNIETIKISRTILAFFDFIWCPVIDDARTTLLQLLYTADTGQISLIPRGVWERDKGQIRCLRQNSHTGTYINSCTANLCCMQRHFPCYSYIGRARVGSCNSKDVPRPPQHTNGWLQITSKQSWSKVLELDRSSELLSSLEPPLGPMGYTWVLYN